MAKLTEDPYPMPDFGSFGDFESYNEAQQEALSNVDDPIIKFHIADGYAMYRVVDFEYDEPCECCGRGGEPLLQHIPHGDAYQARAPTIKGLTTADARRKADQ